MTIEISKAFNEDGYVVSVTLGEQGTHSFNGQDLQELLSKAAFLVMHETRHRELYETT
jgi:hypothetical protein